MRNGWAGARFHLESQAADGTWLVRDRFRGRAGAVEAAGLLAARAGVRTRVRDAVLRRVIWPDEE